MLRSAAASHRLDNIGFSVGLSWQMFSLSPPGRHQDIILTSFIQKTSEETGRLCTLHSRYTSDPSEKNIFQSLQIFLVSIYGLDSSYAVYINFDSVALRCNKYKPWGLVPGGIKKESQLERFPVIFSWSIPSPSVRDMTGLSEMKLNLMCSHLVTMWHNGDSVQVFSNEGN